MKEQMVAEIRQRMHQWYDAIPNPKGDIGGCCLFWAFFTAQVLIENNFDAVIQAGTAYWPRLTKEQDDGKETTFPQFGYEFRCSPVDHINIINGILPEMHVWVAIVSPKIELVDLTSGFFVERGRKAGFDWPGVKPPSYFWDSHLPEGVAYISDPIAVKMVYEILKMLTAGNNETTRRTTTVD